LVAQTPSIGPLPDQRPLEFRRRAEHVQQETGCRVLHIRVQRLRHRDESYAVLFQHPDVVQAVHQGPAKRSNFQTRMQSSFLARASAINRIKTGAARFCSTHHVLVQLRDLPAVVLGVGTQFPDL
jgi:hypothetical protein